MKAPRGIAKLRFNIRLQVICIQLNIKLMLVDTRHRGHQSFSVCLHVENWRYSKCYRGAIL